MTPTELIAARQALGFTQAGMANAFGVSRSTIDRWEHGRTPIPAAIELALATLERKSTMATLAIEALSRDAYNRISLGGADPASLPAMYAAQESGFVEYTTPAQKHEPGDHSTRRALSSFTAEEIAEAVRLAAERAG